MVLELLMNALTPANDKNGFITVFSALYARLATQVAIWLLTIVVIKM